MISCSHPASRCTLRAPDGIRTSVLATIVFLGSVWLIHDWHRATSLVWLIYLFKRPPPVLWDYIHSRANGSSGIWRYGSSVHPELLCYIESHHPEYDSLLDVASNLGIMLGRLQKAHPNASHVGTDISSEMVSSTRRRCPSCSTHQFDLQRLLDDASFKPGRAGVPEAADLVLVSDGRLAACAPAEAWLGPALVVASVTGALLSPTAEPGKGGGHLLDAPVQPRRSGRVRVQWCPAASWRVQRGWYRQAASDASSGHAKQERQTQLQGVVVAQRGGAACHEAEIPELPQ